jgi:serine/threonine protein kinase
VNNPDGKAGPDAQDALPHVPDLELKRRIGQGGFGEVWLAANRATGRLRAVKLIPLRSAGRADPAGREIVSLTHLEAQAGMHHVNLLSIHHVGKTDRHLFYIMDLADDLSGGKPSCDETYRPATLAGRLETGPLEAEECLRCARQLLSGLAHLHAAGMVHRDVKPGNCLFIDGQLKLADFGLLTPASPHVSRVGTAAYMPPDGQMDARADVYAAGLVIYEMMTGLPCGSLPSLGSNVREVAGNPALRRLNRLVLRACQRDPKLRFADAREMLAALDSGRNIDPGVKRRRPLALVVASSLFLLAAGATAFWFTRPPRVDVNFITEPYEATILIDGVPQLQSDGTPYTTPCTVTGLSAQEHSVAFQREGSADRDAGKINFSKMREVTARWVTDEQTLPQAGDSNKGYR